MGTQNCTSQNWFDLLQTAAIVGSLLFAAAGFLLAAYEAWKDERARKIGNSIAINEQYVRIWTLPYIRPELQRVESQDVDLAKAPVSREEEQFVAMLILHSGTVFRAMKYGEIVEFEGLRRDIRSFFNLPIPREIWRKMAPFQNRDFVEFVEAALK